MNEGRRQSSQARRPLPQIFSDSQIEMGRNAHKKVRELMAPGALIHYTNLALSRFERFVKRENEKLFE
jgi:hypothetical protein